MVDNRSLVRRILDQDVEEACTGFAVCAAAELLYAAAFPEQALELSARWAYRNARRCDPWPGENYEGSTLRAALEGWQRHGVCDEQDWRFSPYLGPGPAAAFDLVGWEGSPTADALASARRHPLSSYHRLCSLIEVKNAVHANRVALVGASIHTGWLIAGEERIRFDGTIGALNPHAFVVVGYDDHDASFNVVNSWGAGWGVDGFGRLSYDDLRVNLIDAWTAVIPSRG